MERPSLGAERARLELLLDVARACSSTLDRAGILHTLAERIIAGLGAAGASFTDVDHATGTFHAAVHRVAPGRAPMVAGTHGVPISDCPFLERVICTGTAAAAYVDDPHLSQDERAFLSRHGMRAEVLAPIVTGGRVTCLLEVFWESAERISPETVVVCAAIAEQAGVALENARLYAAEADLRRRAEARARRLEHVQRVGERLKADLDEGEIARRVVEATREASGFRMVVLNLVDDPDDPVSPWRVVTTLGIPPEGVEALCAHSYTVADVQHLFRPEYRISRSYFIPEEMEQVAMQDVNVPRWRWEPGEPDRAGNAWRGGDELLVPLTDREESRLIGFLSVNDPESGLRPEVEEVELLEIFADQAVVALRNAALLDRARQTAFERARAEEIARASAARLHAVLHSSPILLFCLDDRGHFTLSTGDLGLLGLPSEDLTGRSLTGLFAGRPELPAHYARAVSGEQHTATVEVGRASVEIHWTPERDGDGAVAGVIAVAVDVTERVTAQQAAEGLARMRSDFVASVSHELRTPLTAIIGYGELLQARWGVIPDEQKRENLARIVVSANRQKRLVEDLLLLSRMEVGDLQPKVECIPVAQAVARAADEVGSAYQGQRIDLAGPADVLARADLERVVQILVNLIDNAAKYSPEGSPIAVAWAQDGEDVAVRVRDQGPGIPDQGREHLFARFGRMPGGRTRAGRVGTGLGLHLGRQLAEAMHGALDLESTGPGGSTFCLRLPPAPD